MQTIKYRLMRVEDSPALQAIMTASPDAGLIQFSYEYEQDLIKVHSSLGNDVRGVVALRDDSIIGMFLGDLLQVQWAGEIQDAVYISNLRVHPEYRRRGVARGMSQWGLSYVEDQLGADAILYGAVMESNTSLYLAQQYGFISTHLIQGGVVPMRNHPPKSQPNLEVRQAVPDDLPEIVDSMNRFYQDYDLWSPVSANSLRSFIGQQVADIFPNQLYVVSRGGKLLAGLSLSDRTSLVRMRIAKSSAILRLMGVLLGILPRSGDLKTLTVRRVWFECDELEAGRYLWQQIRYQLRGRADSLGIAYDPRSPLHDLFQLPFWLPMFKARYLVRTSDSSHKLIYCLAGP